MNSCPECNQQLRVCQINDTKAVYMCNNNSCKYPSDGVFTIIERKYEDVKSKDVDEIIDELLSTFDSSHTNN